MHTDEEVFCTFCRVLEMKIVQVSFTCFVLSNLSQSSGLHCQVALDIYNPYVIEVTSCTVHHKDINSI